MSEAITAGAVDLSKHTTLRIPATGDMLLDWHGVEELHQLRQQWYPKYPEVLVLGHGSNMLIARHVDRPCLRSKTQGINIVARNHDEVIIDVDAGYTWNDLVHYTLQKRWFGLENLVSIPGTVGAAPVQNIGAYGSSFEDVCVSVTVFDWRDATEKQWQVHDCGFGYRTSRFKPAQKNGHAPPCGYEIITSVQLRLKLEPSVVIENSLRDDAQKILSQPITDDIDPAQLAEVIAKVRASKLPDYTKQPNAGSFFHNVFISKQTYTNQPSLQGMPHFVVANSDTVKVLAAPLIDTLGWKGRMESGASVSKDHALCLINNGVRDGRAMLEFAEKIGHDVKQKYGIDLAIEPAVFL